MFSTKKTEEKPTHTYETINESKDFVDGTCKWFNGGWGFVQSPKLKQDVMLRKAVLPVGKDGRPIEPKNEGGRVRFRYGTSKKDGKEVGLIVTQIEVIDQFVREAKVA